MGKKGKKPGGEEGGGGSGPNPAGQSQRPRQERQDQPRRGQQQQQGPHQEGRRRSQQRPQRQRQERHDPQPGHSEGDRPRQESQQDIRRPIPASGPPPLTSTGFPALGQPQQGFPALGQPQQGFPPLGQPMQGGPQGPFGFMGGQVRPLIEGGPQPMQGGPQGPFGFMGGQVRPLIEGGPQPMQGGPQGPFVFLGGQVRPFIEGGPQPMQGGPQGPFGFMGGQVRPLIEGGPQPMQGGPQGPPGFLGGQEPPVGPGQPSGPREASHGGGFQEQRPSGQESRTETPAATEPPKGEGGPRQEQRTPRAETSEAPKGFQEKRAWAAPEPQGPPKGGGKKGGPRHEQRAPRAETSEAPKGFQEKRAWAAPEPQGPPKGGGPRQEPRAPEPSEAPKKGSYQEQRAPGQDSRAETPVRATPEPRETPRGAGKKVSPDKDDRRPSTTSSDSGSTQASKATSFSSVQSMPEIELLEIKRKKDIDRSQKSGKKIKLAVNHMALTLPKYESCVYHYDVIFDPDKPKYLLRPAIRQFFKENFPNRFPIFDGVKNLFSNGPLVPNDRGLTKTVSVFNEETQKNKDIMVTIAVVNRIDLNALHNYQKDPKVNPYPALLVVDVAMRASLHHGGNLIETSRKFFSPPKGRIIELGDGVELWHGHFQAATLGWKPFLNIDISNTGFHSAVPIETLMTMILSHYTPGSELQPREKDYMTKHLKGLKVDFAIPNQANSRRTFRVNGVMNPPSKEKFRDDNKKEWTVKEYFRVQRNCMLQQDYLPCLWVGSREKKILIPAELCRVSPGQPNNRKLNENQTSQMVRNATCNTLDRKNRIMDAFKGTRLDDPSNPYMKEFGISVSGKFEEVDGRILDAPPLEYGGAKQVNVDRGMWRASFFLNPTTLSKWAILNLDSRTREDGCQTLSKEMCKGAGSLGMTIQPASAIRRISERDCRGPGEFPKRVKGEMEKFKEEGMQMVMVIVPDSGDTYSKVKTIAELTVGLLTQCIKSSTVFRKLNGATIGNILLKVNAKLAGKNHTIAKVARPPCLNNPVMIVGADVTHPAPGSTDMPSIAAVAASHDPKAFQYNMIWRMQPRGEMIRDLENIIAEQLIFFKNKTNFAPQKILFFRDGVSEGEIQKVMSLEVSAIRRACKRMNENFQPAITFIIVQKRHHTRFFPINPDDRMIYDRKNYNLPAGTVVDSQIVHPFETEFLLLSHASILGTARPTKYRLVHDDSDFTDEELEKLTYYLCHMFSRCTRTVSYPAPTYYAHLAAFRARHYLEVMRPNLQNLPQEQERRKMHPELMSTNPMFFV